MSKELAADYFSRHPLSSECFITSDGRVFHSKGSADGFANGLKEATVVQHTREGKATETKNATPKVITLEDVQAFNAETATYPEIKALVDGLKLESVSQKKADLLVAIEAYKAIINAPITE